MEGARLHGRGGREEASEGGKSVRMEAGAAAEVVGAAVGPTVASPAQAGTGQPLDFELPLTAVVRILKRKLPDGVAVSKEAKVAFAKSAGLFILYLTAAYVSLAVAAVAAAKLSAGLGSLECPRCVC